MKFSVMAFCLLFFLPFSSVAQNEIGLQFGLSNYYGDLANTIVPSESHVAAGLLYRYNITSKWKVRAGLLHTRVSGTDRTNDLEQFSNLDFRSSITELSFGFEYNFVPFIPGSSSLTISPYIFGGIAGFYFNPQAEYLGTYINLQFLGTEGQNIPGSNIDPYSKFAIAVPFGIGFKKTVSDQLVFGIELGLRATLTDYLDDVSSYYPDATELISTQNGDIAAYMSDRRPEVDLEPAVSGSLRGDPNNNDFYGTFLFTLTKKLGQSPCYAF